MILRKVCAEEVKTAYQCIEDAREYQRAQGFEQWHEGYPTLQLLQEDCEAGIGFVFVEDEAILGYCCMVLGDEPAYYDIDGAWKTDRPYGVVHRMAFGNQGRGKGLAVKAIALIKNYCVEHGIEAIRVDTQEENKVMQHILNREGFVYCGMIHFDNGPKMAFEWDL